MRAQTVSEQQRLLAQVRLVIARHYGRRLTVAVVARALATSPRQVQRAYAHFGDSSFGEDLRRRRMVAAAELLAQQAIPVGDVARLVGYRQPPHFAKVFRRHYGVNPARFRAQLRTGAARR